MAAASTESRRPPKGYEKVKAKEDKEKGLDASEIKVTSASQGRYISYAIKLLEPKEAEDTEDQVKDENQIESLDTIRICGMGNAIYNAVNVAEIVKRRVAGLHQITELGSQEIKDVWLPKKSDDGEEWVRTRNVSTIVITLSTKELDKTNKGYQEPIPDSEVSKQDPEKRKERRGGAGRGGGRGRGVGRPDDRDRDGDEVAPRRGRGGRGNNRNRDDYRDSRDNRDNRDNRDRRDHDMSRRGNDRQSYGGRDNRRDRGYDERPRERRGDRRDNNSGPGRSYYEGYQSGRVNEPRRGRGGRGYGEGGSRRRQDDGY